MYLTAVIAGGLMELRDYIAIRRAYNLVRQSSPRESRMTFAEFAMLCRINVLARPLTTTEIATYQNVLRPTMTHRTKHLSEMGLLERSKGDSDRRHILCAITDGGEAFVRETCEQLCIILRLGTALKRIDWERACRYVDAMGSVELKASDLVLLGILNSDGGITVSALVDMLGLLQPTVSMSVSALEKAGLICHERDAVRRLSTVMLTQEGRARGDDFCRDIDSLVVHRR